MKGLLCILAMFPFLSFPQVIKPRDYKKGNQFQYRLTTESYRNDQPDGKTIAISRHRIIEDSGKLVEEIRWISKTVIRKDTLHLDSVAQRVPPYTLSLLPGGKLSLPPLLLPEMTGEITDLHTFYVAVSPALHIDKLGPNHLSFKDSLLKGNFADGRDIIKGEDCIQVTQRLLIREKSTSVVETSFTPPYYTCINPFIDTIAMNTFEMPNNFQMVRRGNPGRVNLLWGTEEFIITSTVDNRSGQLLKAEMMNLLHLRMRYNSSEDLKTYDAEIPLTIRRVLLLELIK